MTAKPLSFTKSRIEKLKPPPDHGSVDWYFDDHENHTRKLRLRVSHTSAMSWYYYGKVSGVPRRILIGDPADVSVDEARKIAAKYSGKIADGKDPHLKKQRKRERRTRKSITLANALELHLANKAHKHSSRTSAEYRKVFHVRTDEQRDPAKGKMPMQEPQFERWMHKPLIRITESMVETWFRRRVKKAPAAAAVEARYLRAVCNSTIAEHQELREHGNPCDVISRKSLWPTIQPRKGYIRPKQMHGFLHALHTLPDDIQNAQFSIAKDFLRWLLFSGCRVDETAKLKPSDINIEERFFVLRDPKNRQKDTELPLNDELLKIALKRLENGDGYLFADKSGDKPIQTPRKAIIAIRKLSGVHFTPHDLRRTFRTTAAKISLPMKVGAMLVNHKITGELKVDLDYIQVEPEELLTASNRVANELLRQSQDTIADVLELHVHG